MREDYSKLRHLVIIPDGNRRWARRQKLPFWRGHQEGSRRFKEIVEETFRQKIPYLTIWIASQDNLKKRSATEVRFLYQLFHKTFSQLLKNPRIQEDEVRIRILGFWQTIVPQRLEEIIQKLTTKTRPYRKFNLTFLLAYDGIEEMLRAIQEMIQDSPRKVNYNTVKKYLVTSDLPPVDFIIRTGGEPHNSAGFMMWHSFYSQYYFTPTLLPDFTKKHLRKAIADFKRRERRFGG